MKRAKKSILYHGRQGRPKVHQTKTGRKYIMVRAKGGGTRRLYSGSLYGEGRHGTGRKRRLSL